jgi:hypothetical protein
MDEHPEEDALVTSLDGKVVLDVTVNLAMEVVTLGLGVLGGVDLSPHGARELAKQLQVAADVVSSEAH